MEAGDALNCTENAAARLCGLEPFSDKLVLETDLERWRRYYLTTLVSLLDGIDWSILRLSGSRVAQVTIVMM